MQVKSLLRRLSALDASSPARHSQSVLVLRLCGSVLERDVPDAAARTKLANDAWTEMEADLGVDMTVDHYNALLAAYQENGHAFCPEHVQARLHKGGVKPNKETYRALLDRYCQEGNMEGANAMLKALFEEHKVVEEQKHLKPKPEDKRKSPTKPTVKVEEERGLRHRVGLALAPDPSRAARQDRAGDASHGDASTTATSPARGPAAGADDDARPALGAGL